MIRAWTTALLAPLLATGAARVPASAPAPAKSSGGPLVGIYYFPGWTSNRADGEAGGWAPIARFPERQPDIGWYDDSDPATMARQLAQMRRGGIGYVAFDWYWEDGHVHADEAVRAYLQAPQTSVDFSLLWANDKPFAPDQWQAIVRFWIVNYFRSPRYLTVGGKPVVFVLTYQGFAQSAQNNGTTPAALVATAQRMAREAGLPGLYLIADFDDLSTTLVTDDAVKAGFSAVSAYNMHRGPWRGERPGWYKLTRGYPALDRAYRQHWAEGFRGTLPVVVPMISGWDRRPWGGSADPLHDRSVATTTEFMGHLLAARAMMRRYRGQAPLGVICCWNEFGEGSYVEPTRGEGSAKLNAVARVFGGGR